MSTLAEWINPALLAPGALERLQKTFSSAQPYSHAIVSSFLIEDKAQALLAALQKEPFTHKESDLFSLNQTVDFSSSKQALLKSFYAFASSREFADFMRQLTGLAVKPGALDLAGSLYQSGDYLLCHDDQVEDRKIAYIVYLSHGFSEKDGARFIMFDSVKGRPKKVVASHPPAWNSLMLFEVSPVSFHMVEENMGSKDRYAIGGWLH